MALPQPADDLQRFREAVFPGREAAPVVTVHRVNVRLVDRDVFTHEVAQIFDDVIHEPQKNSHGVRAQEGARALEPQGIGEMMNGQQRPDAAVPQQQQLFADTGKLLR